MYFDDHGVPHFHILSSDSNASVAIETLELLAGNVPADILKEAISWASKNKKLLHNTWKEYSL